MKVNQKLNQTKNHFPRYMCMGYYEGLAGSFPVYGFVKSLKDLEGAESPCNKFVNKSILVKHKVFAKNKSELNAKLWWTNLSREERAKYNLEWSSMLM